MSIFSKLYWRIKREQISILADKVKKEGLKLSFAVVVAEALMVGGFYFASKYGITDYFKPKTIYIVNEAHAKTIEKEKVEEVREVIHIDEVAELAEMIYNLESSGGKNNYSKCEAIGKINGIGYGIPGNGKYQCFNNHEEEMQVLKGWIIDKRAKGMTDNGLLCLYSGNNYNFCD